MKEFVVTAVFTVFFTLVAVSLPSLSQFLSRIERHQSGPTLFAMSV